MKKVLTAALFLAAVAAAGKADPPAAPKAPVVKAAAPPAKAIRFPTVNDPSPKPVVVPVPKADPAAPFKLGVGQFYVVASPDPLVILTSGPGAVTLKERKPPFMLTAAQAIGWTPDPQDPEFVTWGADYPYLYVMTPSKSGDVVITVVPALNKTDAAGKQIPLAVKDVSSKALLVDDGTSPVPPPKPKVDPVPDPPTPKTDVLPTPAKGFRVLFLYDKEGKLSTEELNIANSSKIAAYLNQKCAKGEGGRPEWRKWDATTVARPDALTKESPVLKVLYDYAKPKLGPLPQIVVAVDQNAVTLPWEPTEDAMLTLLRRYGN
jgi:hypothetical protein